MSKMNVVDWLALALVTIGAINWGLVGIWNFNIVEFITGTMTILAKAIYILVGMSGIYSLYSIISGRFT